MIVLSFRQKRSRLISFLDWEISIYNKEEVGPSGAIGSMSITGRRLGTGNFETVWIGTWTRGKFCDTTVPSAIKLSRGNYGYDGA